MSGTAQKLTADDALLIKQCISERRALNSEAVRLSDKALASKFDVSIDTIKSIGAGRSWKYIGLDMP